MQPLTAVPRTALLASDVVNLVTSSPSVKVQSGLEVIDQNMALVSDISGTLQNGSSVSSDAFAVIHRACTVVLDADAPFDYMSQFVKPYLILTDTVSGFTARFNLGVYTLASPSPDLSLSPGQSIYSGYDLLQILNQPIGDTYSISQNADPVASAQTLIQTIFPGALFNADANAKLADRAYIWPLDSQNQFTYLTVVNDLLGMVGYAPMWADWDGIYQMHPYVDPTNPLTPIEWAFDLSEASKSVVVEARSVYQDLFDVPNQWVYVMQNLTAAPVEGTTQFTFTDGISPTTGLGARGRVVRKVVFVDAVDFASLLIQAAFGIERDLYPTEAVAIGTFPIPLFWHRDIVTYNDPSLAELPPLFSPFRRCMVSSWNLPLDVISGDMGMTLVSLFGATTDVLD